MGRGYTTRPRGQLSQRGYCDALHSDSGPGATMAANRCRRTFSDTRILADLHACARAYCRRPADRAHRPAAAAPPRLPARHDAQQRQRHLYRPLARALWRVRRGRGAAVQAPARAGGRGGRGRANIGAFTLPIAKRIGLGGHVHAFEPQRPIHALLRVNLALNGLGNVTAHRAGLGATPGELRLPRIHDARPGYFGAHALKMAATARPSRSGPWTASSFPAATCSRSTSRAWSRR